MNGKYQKFALAIMLPLLISACGSQTASKDTTAQATLDYTNNVIIKPLDEYSIGKMTDNYNRLYDVLMKRCTSQKGTPYVATEQEVPVGSREYGFWNPSYIEKYGYKIFESAEEAAVTEQMQNNINDCATNDSDLQNIIAKLESTGKVTEITDRLQSEARGYALKDKEWEQARQDWWTCLKDEGLTPRTDEEAWTSQQLSTVDDSTVEGRQEKVRIVLTEAECSQKTGMAQKLADLEASFQAPLIAKNQAALNEAKNAIQTFNTEIDTLYQSIQ